MGLFKSIKKVFKKIVKGVKKVFKKIGKFVGKIMSSKIGKILMIGLTVFTLGTALMAGAGAFSAAGAAGGNLFTQVVAGGKEFALALVGKGGTDVAANAATTQTAGGTINMDVLGKSTKAFTGTAGPVAPTVSSAAQLAGSSTAAGTAQAATTGTGFLSKAAQMGKNVASAPVDAAGSLGSAAWNTLKTPTGMMVAGNAASGYAQARLAAEAEQARVDKEAADNASWTNSVSGPIDANTVATPLDPRRFNPNFVAPQEQSPMKAG